MVSTRIHHRPDLDGLRALAVLMVVAHHAFPGWLPGGFLGVDVFFVISGYLISQILMRSIDGGGPFRVVEFYRRRIQRIFPALILVVTVTLALGWWLTWPQEYRQLGQHAAANAVFLLNIELASESGYFDNAAQLKPLLHLWSLSVEEQFYLVWPWGLRFALRWAGGKRALPLLIGLAAASLVTMHLSARSDAAATFFMPQARAWELTLGAVAALVQCRHASTWTRLRDRFLPAGACGLLGLALILASCVVITPQRSASVALLLPVVGATLVLLADPGQRATQMLLANRPAVALGLISYPLYLWHWPLLSLASVVESGLPALWIRVAIVLVSGVLAWLTFVLLERRVRHTTEPLAPWLLLTLLAATGAFGHFIDTHDGLPARTRRVNTDLAQFEWEVPRWAWNEAAPICRDRARNVHGIQAYCNQSLPAPPQVALFGDSHALQLYPGLAERLGRTNQSLLLLGASGCPPGLDLDVQWTVDRKPCREVINAALDTLLQTPSIRTILVAHRGPFYIEGLPTDFEQHKDPGARIRLAYGNEPVAHGDNVPAYRQAMARTLAALRQSGKRVVLVIDAPEIGLEPRDCLPLREHTLTPHPVNTACAITVEAYRQRAHRYLEVTQALLKDFGDLDVWDLPRAFCDDRLCHGMAGDRALYRDANHLSVNGSRWIAERYAPEPARGWTGMRTTQAADAP